MYFDLLATSSYEVVKYQEQYPDIARELVNEAVKEVQQFFTCVLMKILKL